MDVVDLIVPDGSWLEATRINLRLPAAPRVRLANDPNDAVDARESAEPCLDPLDPAADGTAHEPGPHTPRAFVNPTEGPVAERSNGPGSDAGHGGYASYATYASYASYASYATYAADALSLKGESSLEAVARALGAPHAAAPPHPFGLHRRVPLGCNRVPLGCNRVPPGCTAACPQAATVQAAAVW